MGNEIEKIERRPLRYWFEDGIYEMAFGAFCLAGGFYLYANTWIPRRSLWSVLWGVGSIPLIFFGSRFISRTLRALKEKWTYPRTGYVSYLRPKKKRFSLVGALVGGGTPLIVGLLKEELFPQWESISWYALFTGIIFAATQIWIGLMTDIARFFVLAVISGAAGIVLSGVGLGEMPALGALMGILGASKIISGAIAFRLHLRRHPTTGEERL